MLAQSLSLVRYLLQVCVDDFDAPMVSYELDLVIEKQSIANPSMFQQRKRMIAPASFDPLISLAQEEVKLHRYQLDWSLVVYL